MRQPWILVCAILAGCATYQPKPIDSTQLAQRFDERSLTSNALRSYLAQQLGHAVEPWPLSSWNRDMLTYAADYYSPALELARAQWVTAKTGITTADARPNPVLQFPFEYTTNHVGAGRPVTTGPAFDIPIETAHKRDYRVKQATYSSEATRMNWINEAWKVRSQIRDALLSIFTETKHAVFLTRKVSLQQQIVDMLRQRESVGETARPDVNHAELVLTQSQTELAVAQRALQDTRAHLAIAIGLPLSAFDAVELDLNEFEYIGTLPPLAEARRAAIFHRADLRGALAEYEASQAALQLEIAKQYPDVHIGLGYTYDVGANKISLGLAGVTLPVFDRNQGAIAQAEAKRSEMAAHTAALQDGIINGLEHALSRYREGQETFRLSVARLAMAGNQMRSQTASFAAGATDRLALTQAESDYQSSAIGYLNELVTMQQAAGMLEDAMQQPLPTGTTRVSMPKPEMLK